MTKHLCKNWLENERCTKCRRPEWSLYLKINHKVGDKVAVPHYYHDKNKVFVITKKNKDGYTLGEKGLFDICCYEWWELYPLKKSVVNKK